MIFRVLLLAVIPLSLIGSDLLAESPAPRFKADYVITHNQEVAGKIIAVEGLVRFDRLSQRAFLYKDLSDMRKRNFQQTIFLELGNEHYASMKIPDGSNVLVTGYLSKELRGPLGVYAGHMIVDRMQRLSPSER